MRFKLLALISLLIGVPAAMAMVGGGDVEFKVTGAGPVVFSHESHVGAHFQACTDCHASPFTTRAQHKQVSMAQMAQGLSCGACHNGTRAFSVKENCQVCHQ
jgi:c(7)-type cytochrome triheme protein